MRVVTLIVKYLVNLGPIAFFSYLYQRFILKKETLRIKVRGLPYKIAIRNNTSDISLFANIFILKEYDVKPEKEVKIIVDCGANIGLASLFFLTEFPAARIIAVEPEPSNFTMLRQNLLNYPNVTCLKKAMWNKSTHLNIKVGSGNHAFTVEESEMKTQDSIEGISLRDLMEQSSIKNIDILKVDIEGSEEQVFLNDPASVRTSEMIFCEIHETMKAGLTAKIIRLFSQDYDIFMHAEYHVFKKKK